MTAATATDDWLEDAVKAAKYAYWLRCRHPEADVGDDVPWLDGDDLVQVALIECWRCRDKWDPSRATKRFNYFVTCARHAITRALRDARNPIRHSSRDLSLDFELPGGDRFAALIESDNRRAPEWDGLERCIRGHVFTPENTYWWTRPTTGTRQRQCRACRNIHANKRIR